MKAAFGALSEEFVTAPRVVIVGGGFGGLYAARELIGAPVHVTLIDKRNYHLFRPMPNQVATGLLSSDEIAAPLRCILSRQLNMDVPMDEVIGIDSVNRLVCLRDRAVPYDFLILATGIHCNYFGYDERRAIATPLESLEGADIIRTRVQAAQERAESIAAYGEADVEEIRRQLTFVLVGGGAVGVDTAHVVAPARNLIGIPSSEPMVLPGVAQLAIQEGKYVSRLIRKRVKNRSAPALFWYWIREIWLLSAGLTQLRISVSCAFGESRRGSSGRRFTSIF